MKINLIAIGTNMPSWVKQGFDEYCKRMPSHCPLNLIELPMTKRPKNADIDKLKQQEAKQLLSAVPKNNMIIALDEKGKQYTTKQLANQFEAWQQSGYDISLLIGGPDGLDASCIEKANLELSLSLLTLPHPLVRITVAEQLYRVMTVIQGHPYHR